MWYCNYRATGVTGPAGNRPRQRATADAAHRQRRSIRFNGVFVTNGYGAAGGRRPRIPACPGRPSGSRVTDGTSNTAAFSEIAHGLVCKTDYSPHGSFEDWNWWTSGNLGDTSYVHFWPINPQKTLTNLHQDDQAGTFVNGASSFHPGGVNVAIRGRLSPIHQGIDRHLGQVVGGVPAGVTFNPPIWTVNPGTKIGVWQALAQSMAKSSAPTPIHVGEIQLQRPSLCDIIQHERPLTLPVDGVAVPR